MYVSALKHSPSKRKSISRPLRSIEGELDITVVSATGNTSKHTTSPSTLEEKSTTGDSMNILTELPVATSTPINLPTTITTSDGQATLPSLAITSTVRASYPAVLKGRSGASPPIPNLTPSGKTPPPVPPRGTRKKVEDHRGENISSSSSTSGRGDVNIASRLHDHKEITGIQEKIDQKTYPSLLHALMQYVP
ncbi:Protein of unknown function [Cotesia congregata]|uniref:Uncharacterized protein n=1 Tax=Cotesia congregata TaxID=51543 RepID=A0A8J2HGQ1_COTCN|nr:Protein of unknown function [Cotesia congregata]